MGGDVTEGMDYTYSYGSAGVIRVKYKMQSQEIIYGYKCALYS